jgi:hypothetical protein
MSVFLTPIFLPDTCLPLWWISFRQGCMSIDTTGDIVIVIPSRFVFCCLHGEPFKDIKRKKKFYIANSLEQWPAVEFLHLLIVHAVAVRIRQIQALTSQFCFMLTLTYIAQFDFCCDRLLDTHRAKVKGHCTMERGCCIRSRGFDKPDRKKIYKKYT